VAELRAVGITKRFGSVVALDTVTMEVHPGECVALVGETGSGKSTLLRTFNRLVEPDDGAVYIDGTSAASLDPVALRRRIGYVPQDGGLLPHWRVRRNVALVPWLSGRRDADERGRRALTLVGLDPANFASRWPRALSGGERQRVALARALAGDPAVLLLDEPFGALDAVTRSELQATFRDLRRRVNLTAILVTHDVREALTLGDRVAVLRRGRLEQIGSPSELTRNPATPFVSALLAEGAGA
jgi:osmoprotectant transport system ATP-binding protein